MLASLPSLLRIPLVVLVLSASTLLHVGALVPVTLAKLLVPVAAWRRGCSRALVGIAEAWIAVNSTMIGLATRTRWSVEGADGLRRHVNYLVLSNHQSWVDIPVLQKVFNRRIPFLRFFLKRQLIWIPLLGQAWWALDFPFMRRHSREAIARKPALRQQDREATRRACARYAGLEVSVMNFVEGTRFRPEKHVSQQSPYRRLLKPRAGGAAFVLDAMTGALQSVLDVTIHYPGGRPSFSDLFFDRIREIRVHVRERAVPTGLPCDYGGDATCRDRAQAWINDLWREKDALIERWATTCSENSKGS